MDVQAEIWVAHVHRQSVSEEVVNTVTHGTGLLLSATGAVPLILSASRYAGRAEAVACGVYAATLVAVYAASSLLHSARDPRWKRLFRSWDQGVIYLLIAGTYTPFALTYLRRDLLWLFLAAMWFAAGFGLLSKVVLQHRIDAVSVASYMLLGWLPAMAMVGEVSWPCLRWLLLGGMCYTAGTPFLKLDQRYPYFHAAWHVLVLGGSACHYLAIMHNVAAPAV